MGLSRSSTTIQTQVHGRTNLGILIKTDKRLSLVSIGGPAFLAVCLMGNLMVPSLTNKKPSKTRQTSSDRTNKHNKHTTP